jgi:hypothetical protein
MYIDSQYNIEWEPIPIHENVSHIFLTHGDPFMLSTFTNNNNNKIVLNHSLEPGDTHYEWKLPYELNHYEVSPINWRMLLSNTSTPYSGNIGSPTNNLIILSDFFTIYSNMNISRTANDFPLYRYQPYNFTTAGFTDNFIVKLFLTNITHNIPIGEFHGNPVI